jgi:hypothetical protein
MAQVRALRGVCIAPGRHLTAGERVDLPNDSTLQFLVSITAVEVVKDEPAAIQEPDSVPAKKSGKEK